MIICTFAWLACKTAASLIVLCIIYGACSGAYIAIQANCLVSFAPNPNVAGSMIGQALSKSLSLLSVKLTITSHPRYLPIHRPSCSRRLAWQGLERGPVGQLSKRYRCRWCTTLCMRRAADHGSIATEPQVVYRCIVSHAFVQQSRFH